MCKKLTWFSVVLMLLTLGLMGQAFIVRGGDLPDELKVGGFLLGPQAWSFRLFTFFEAVDKAKEAGCKVIEAFPGQILSPTDSVQFNHNAAPEIWAKAQQKLESAGVRLVNYGVVNWQDKAEARKVFEFAKKMNIPAITTEPHDNSPEMVDLIEQLAKEFDIKVGFHNHPKRPDQPEYKWWDPNFVAERVKGRDKRLGAAADTGHWLRSGVRPIDGLKVLEGRIISVHRMNSITAKPTTFLLALVSPT